MDNSGRTRIPSPGCARGCAAVAGPPCVVQMPRIVEFRRLAAAAIIEVATARIARRPRKYARRKLRRDARTTRRPTHQLSGAQLQEARLSPRDRAMRRVS